ncbi:MAG: hypothetical protein KF866_12480 [Phycisphaeraceae bacterium]|nr:hypothetical protein [Phycisphaeraceae bacterium]MCW5754072.1 hypothetical protein [Phycisphaeraceae bacterium]
MPSTPASIPPSAESLVERAQRLHALFESLDALSLELARLCASDNQPGDELAELVARRQVLVDAILATDGSLPAGRDATEYALRTLCPEDAHRVRDTLAACRTLAAVISDRDAEQHRLLESRRETMARELAEIFRARTATRGYAPAAPNSPRFQDQEA